jgi:catechol 2,3-dioxygenase-like lactoylglutathione lyase family enzyme
MAPARHRAYLLLVSVLACGTACIRSEKGQGRDPVSRPSTPARDLVANNVFFYYADLARARSFYRETLGMNRVADYGFAAIYQAAPTSFITLVDAAAGMHSADEPKTVAMALVTDELEAWFRYLKERQVPLRSALRVSPGSPHDGFVAIDPEGYFLEFERFNTHPENERLLPRLAWAEAVRMDAAGGRPPGLGIKSTVLWLYYKDLAASQAFYEKAMGLDLLVDQGWAKIYATSPTGYIGLVDAARGMHGYTEKRGVTVSFLTTTLEAWFDHLRQAEGFRLRTPEILTEGDFARVFVGYDPEGYFLEFDTFLDVDVNRGLLTRLAGAAHR